MCEDRCKCARTRFCRARVGPNVRGSFSHRFLNMMFLSCFVGKKTCVAAEDEDAIEEVFEGLSCKKPQVLGGFRLEADDPVNYTDKLSFLDQTRAFPKQAYSQGADFDSNGSNLPKSLRSTSVGKSGPSTSTAGTAQPDPIIDPATAEFKKDLVDWHFRIVQMCKRVGIEDVCSTYKKSRMENLLDGLSKDDLSCKLCKKQFKQLQRLRDHIRLKHLKKTAHYCDICKKYYSDAGALKAHNVKHDEEAAEWGYNQCDQKFTSQAKLRKHQPVHQGKTYSCKFCGVTNWTHPQGVKDHERTCTQNPDFKPDDKEKYKSFCRICARGYVQHRSLLRHLRDKHDNAPQHE